MRRDKKIDLLQRAIMLLQEESLGIIPEIEYSLRCGRIAERTRRKKTRRKRSAILGRDNPARRFPSLRRDGLRPSSSPEANARQEVLTADISLESNGEYVFRLRLGTDNGRRDRVRGDLQTPILNEAKLSEKCHRRILFLVPTLALLLLYLISRIF